MPNALYPLWKQAIMQQAGLDKSLDQTDDAHAPYLSLVTTEAGYTYSAAHQYYTSITNVVGEPAKITNPVVNNTIFSGDTVVYEDIVGTIIGAIVIFRKNAGVQATWRLVLYEDTGVIGLPLTANGGNILVKWNTLGIFSLGQPVT
jgi:hypothetical protein